MTEEERLLIPVRPGSAVTALRCTPESGASDLVFIYAPGAGSNLFDPFGAFIAAELAKEGIECWRFQFPYMEARRRAPDRTPFLEATWAAMIGSASETTGRRVVVGGRSMGGRIASQVVAQGTQVSGLVLFAYPLHPPGKTASVRDEHFAQIQVPALFCSGTRDSFATAAELTVAARLVPRATVRLLDGADHGFGVLKSSGRTRQDVWAEAAVALLSFLSSL